MNTLEQQIGSVLLERYIEELEAIRAHHRTMQQRIADQLPQDHTLLFIDNWVPDFPFPEMTPEEEEIVFESWTGGEKAYKGYAASFRYNFGYAPNDERFVVWVARKTPKPPIPLEQVDGIVISGSAVMVTERRPWVAQEQALIREASEMGIPILGICFGHQLLADTFGGSVEWTQGFGSDYHADQPLAQSGPTNLKLTDAGHTDELVGDASEQGSFWIQAQHSQEVAVAPAQAQTIATHDATPHQGLRYTNRPIWSFQNHPEYSTPMMIARLRQFEGWLEQALQGMDDQSAKAIGYQSIKEVEERLCSIDTIEARRLIFGNFIGQMQAYIRSMR